ncbi:hypothetical protein Q8W71_23295 [Methylobacterium sp. NEAU 140]|uniref:hypothetical protein n=1 Tax=Methylobacterium sp. NEAU 140 TaxID=3064945 RepID=UPI002732C3C6|nr:hypothetical protein [Methylobacterium sp. NEAU 140]MDP4025565.1 hypothetical protein [Methylobacterium sp. NEAU 140]
MRSVTTLLYTAAVCTALLVGAGLWAGPMPAGADARPSGLTTATVLGSDGTQPAS